MTLLTQLDLSGACARPRACAHWHQRTHTLTSACRRTRAHAPAPAPAPACTHVHMRARCGESAATQRRHLAVANGATQRGARQQRALASSGSSLAPVHGTARKRSRDSRRNLRSVGRVFSRSDDAARAVSTFGAVAVAALAPALEAMPQLTSLSLAGTTHRRTCARARAHTRVRAHAYAHADTHTHYTRTHTHARAQDIPAHDAAVGSCVCRASGVRMRSAMLLSYRAQRSRATVCGPQACTRVGAAVQQAYGGRAHYKCTRRAMCCDAQGTLSETRARRHSRRRSARCRS
jgi:hypothetical protein